MLTAFTAKEGVRMRSEGAAAAAGR